MAAWDKVKLYWRTMLNTSGSTLAATSTASGDYDVDYIYNFLTTNMWKAANTSVPMYITYDDVSSTKDADYLIIYGHNLGTIGATVVLQYSTDNITYFDAHTPITPSDDTIIRQEFSAPGVKRYWRLKFTGSLSAAPYIKLAPWGLKTELHWASSEFDPDRQVAKVNVNLTQGGEVSGIHEKFVEHQIEFSINDDLTLYDTEVKDWWDTHGRQQLFIAIGHRADEVWLVRPSTNFTNPFNNTGIYRNLNFSFRGKVA